MVGLYACVGNSAI